MLWIKALHIIFMVTWFAGLFYLPRLFVYHCDVTDAAGQQRFCSMEKKLFGIASIGMLGTLVFGIWLVVLMPGLLQHGWLHAKLGLVVLLIIYHHYLIAPMKAFRSGSNKHSAGFYRIINEIPALALIAIVILVVVKPF